MSPLSRRIADAIGRDGPMSLERFWNVALFDADGGYYTRGHPIGREGDFVTAPEISQMFGELIGAWLLAAWRALGRPSPFVLAEFGPGRGTLMADILRTVRRLDPDFLRAARVRLIETSDRLAAEQIERLAAFDLPVVRVRRFNELDALPLLLVANELFDAVAIRQYRHGGERWRERLVGLDDGRFVFGDAEKSAPALPVPAGPPAAPGAIFEYAPLRESIAAAIGRAIALQGGAALILDYGHRRSAHGDTLQALRAHAFADVLEEPGSRDITSHVDFERLALALGASGVHVSPVAEQGDFLFALGLRERAGALGRNADTAQRDAITAAARRLAGTGPGEMGALFKVLAASSAPLGLPPFPSTAMVD